MCQVSVADLTTSHTAHGTSLAGGEGREVIVEEETFATLVENIVKDFLVELGAQSHCCQSLGLATGKHGGTVRSGKVVHFRPDRTDFSGLAAVETDAFVEHAAAHRFFLHIVVVAFHQRCLGFAFLFGQGFDIFVADGFESLGTPVLVGATLAGHFVSLVVALAADIGTEVFVVCLVAVFALCGGAYFLGELHLGLALHLDGFVGRAESIEEFGFAHLVHLTLDHHDVVVGSAYHEFHVGFLELFECGVDHKLAVDACNAHFGDGTVEGNIADSQSCGGSKPGQAVGRIDTVGAIESDVYECVGVVIVGEQGAEHTVHQTRGENFVVAGASFALEETAWKAAGGGEFFLILHLQGHEVHSLAGFLGSDYRCEEHGVAHAHFYRSIGLLCELAGLDGDSPAVGQCDGFLDRIHKMLNVGIFSINRAKVVKIRRTCK